MSAHIGEVSKNHKFIIIGDINVHLEDLDRYRDATDHMLLEVCVQHDIFLVNTDNKCLGKITWVQCSY